MKITSDHYARLAAMVKPLDTVEHRVRVISLGHSDDSYRWWLYDTAMHSDNWVLQDELYTYLTDKHILPALRKIIPSLDTTRKLDAQ